VALSRAAWERCVRVPEGVECQDEAGRLWGVLWMLSLAARRCDGAEVRFAVHVRNDNGEGVLPVVRLKALAGTGDSGEPVLTALLRDEDRSRGAGRYRAVIVAAASVDFTSP
jgi:hypothetical protein